MLLPSDVARLVLGYLQEEGLSATTKAFIQESPNLKEYAEHTMGDGALPACVFSVFGKGLTTILNEYIAAKTKETCHEVPAVMTSLWKKLDFTLKQIKSFQSTPAVSASQRARSRVGLANLAGQRLLTGTSASSLVCSSETTLIGSPALSSQSMLGHSTPVTYSAPQIRAPPGNATAQQFHDSPIQVIVAEQRPNPGPMSPGRRKWDTPRKRSGGLGVSNGPGKSSMPASNVTAEPQPEEAVEENFPQLVIQNARDKILGDRLLQEKLAENINKILANEPTPQTPKPPSSSIEDDQSIDEILGLQGEIHMSDDAIHDILEQTESDPAFHALFDLFDYKNRTDGEPGDIDMDNIPREGNTAEPHPSTVGQLQSNNDPGITLQDTLELTATPVKNKVGQERKTRKSNSLLKKTVLGSSSKSSQMENSSAKLLITLEEPADENEKEKNFNNRVDASPMDIDKTVDTSAILENTVILGNLECVTKGNLPTAMSLIDSAAVLLTRDAAPAEPVSVDNKKESKQEQGSSDLSALSLLSSQSNQSFPLSTTQVNLSGNPSLSSVAVSAGTTLSQMNLTSTLQSFPTSFCSAGSTVANTTATNTVTACSRLSSIRTFHKGLLDSSTFSSASSSNSGMIGSAVESGSLTRIDSNPNKAATDSNNIVSLKIIISDNADENSSSDKALSQAISSISSEKLPTIYLSSPTKSPRGSGTPKGTNLDETALAVCGLQSSEALANSPSRAGAVVPAHPLPETTQSQQSYIIQLPLETANTPFQGASTSYFFMTEPLTSDTSGRQVQVPTGSSKAPLLPKNNHYGVTTVPPVQSFVTGSTLILPSPVKPMLNMLPVSLMGQNATRNVQMVANQVVGIPNLVPIQQTLTVDPKLSTVAVKPSTIGGIIHNEATEDMQKTVQQHEPKDSSSSHKRMLCFDSATKVQPPTSKPAAIPTSSAVNTSTSQLVTQTKKGRSHTAPFARTATRPAILGGNKPKRKVETVKCSVDPKAGGAQKPQTGSGSRIHVSQPGSVQSSEPETKFEPTAGRNIHNKDVISDNAKVKDCGSLKSVSSDIVLKSVSSKDKGESSRNEPLEEEAEENMHTQGNPNVIADKENKVTVCSQHQQQSSHTPFSSALENLAPPTVTHTPSSQSKIASKTNSVAIEATEMLPNIQGLKSPPRPAKRLGLKSPDFTGPRTAGSGGNQEESMNSPRTPLQQKRSKDAEVTPKNLLPHNTPEIPTCSPASETGSENSINMAAHTLMILSRAAIARTGTPLKNSLRQEVGEKSPISLKNSKKRKQSPPTASPAPKKPLKQSPTKKKKQQKKTIINCFPQDMDVDKFLSSLHYDE
ncbi:protein NPAT [Syngnathoides biaculeatus]|uniref:protein NPAT n=1 Tax=Syngnathoides biaculeatus TaxID=300417 RepID=UPI002ADE416A|nr:protein NPAT [Syngnathoides biaculeatus]